MNQNKLIIEKNIEIGEKYFNFAIPFFIMNFLSIFLLNNVELNLSSNFFLGILYSVFAFLFIFLPMWVIPANSFYYMDLNRVLKKNQFKGFFDKSYLYLFFSFVYIIFIAYIVHFEQKLNNNIPMTSFFVLNCFWAILYGFCFKSYKKKVSVINFDSKLEKIKKNLK